MEKPLDLSKKEDCYKIILDCRKKMSNKNVTQQEWEKIEQQLAQIVITGHADALTGANATLMEMQMRYPYMLMHFWSKYEDVDKL